MLAVRLLDLHVILSVGTVFCLCYVLFYEFWKSSVKANYFIYLLMVLFSDYSGSSSWLVVNEVF